MDAGSMFRQPGRDGNRHRAKETAENPNPSPGYAAGIEAPVWRQFVGNEGFQQTNKEAIRAEKERVDDRNREIARENAPGKNPWQHDDGRLLFNGIEEDPEKWLDDPGVGRLAEDALFTRDRKKAAAEMGGLSLKLQDPSDRRKLTDKQREDFRLELGGLELTGQEDEAMRGYMESRRAEIESALKGDEERLADESALYRARQRKFMFDSGGRDWWREERRSRRDAARTPEQRVQESARQGQANGEAYHARELEIEERERSLAEEEARISERLQSGVASSEIDGLTQRRREIAREKGDLAAGRETLAMERESAGRAASEQARKAADTIDRESHNPEFEVSAMRRGQGLRDEFTKRMQDAKLYSGFTIAASQAKDKQIRRRPDGEWDMPYFSKQFGSDGFGQGVVASLGNVLGSGSDYASALTGARMPDRGSEGTAVDADLAREVIDSFQRDNNLSDRDMQAIWSDAVNSARKWGDGEVLRVQHDGSIEPNLQSSMWLDDGAIRAEIERSEANPTAKAGIISALPKIQTDIATRKAAAYSAAALASGRNGFDEYWSEIGQDVPLKEAVVGYERDIVANDGALQHAAGALINDFFLKGGTKLANTALGVAGMAGSEGAANLAKEGAAGTAILSEGGVQNGWVGAVFEEAPSLIAQIMLTRGMGATASATGLGVKGAGRVAAGGTYLIAGAQSAGLTFAQTYGELLDSGMDPEQAMQQARIDAGKAGVNTGLVTAFFGHGAVGGVESVAVGGNVAGMTLRDLAGMARRQGIGAMLKSKGAREFLRDVLLSAGGEGTEEMVDEFGQAFINQKPDTNLSDALDNALHAFGLGFAISGAVDVGASAIESNDQRKLHEAVEQSWAKRVVGEDPRNRNTRIAAEVQALDPESGGTMEEEVAAGTELIGDYGTTAAVATINEKISTAMAEYRLARDEGRFEDAAKIDADITKMQQEREQVAAADVADAILALREIDAYGAAANDELQAAQETGDPVAIQAAVNRVAGATRAVALLKISAGKGLESLTANEILSLGITRDGKPQKEEGLARVGLTMPAVEIAEDGSPIILDEAIDKLRQITPRGGERVKLSETEARERAAARVAEAGEPGGDAPQGNELPAGVRETGKGAYEVTTQSGNMTISIPGNPDEARKQAITMAGETAPIATTRYRITGRAGTTVEVDAKSKAEAESAGARKLPMGEQVSSVEEIPATSGPPQAAPATGGRPEGQQPAVSPDQGKPRRDIAPGTWVQDGGGFIGRMTSDGLMEMEGGNLHSPSGEVSPLPSDLASEYEADRSKAKKPAAPKKGPVNKVVAKLKKGPLKDKVKIGKGKRAAANLDGTLRVDPDALAKEAAAAGLEGDKAQAWVAKVIDEEVRHLANIEAAREIWKKEGGSPRINFEQWIEDRYKKLWREEFVATGKDKIVEGIYGSTLNSMPEWKRAMEGLRIMSQRLTDGSPTEVARLWTNAGKDLLDHLRAMLRQLKQWAKSLSPELKAEIAALEAKLQEFGYEQGSKTDGDRGKKPPTGKTADGTGDRGRPGEEASDDGAAEPAGRGDDGESVVGKRVRFTLKGESLSGVAQVINSKGLVLVALDEADQAGRMSRLVPESEVELFTPAKGESAAGSRDARIEKQKQEQAEQADQPVTKAKPEDDAPKGSIGKNTRGNYVTEDARGVRSYIDNGIVVTQPVSIIPGRGFEFDDAELLFKNGRREFLTAEEVESFKQAETPNSDETRSKSAEEIKVGDWVKFANKPDEGPFEVWFSEGGRVKLATSTRNLSFNVEGMVKAEAPAKKRETTPEDDAKEDQSTDSKPSAGERALLDALDGLFAAPLDNDYNREIPSDRFMALMGAANTLVGEGVDTPEKLAASLSKLAEGRLMPMTQRIWFALKAAGATGDAEPDWSNVYGKGEKPDMSEESTNDTVESEQVTGRGAQAVQLANLLVERIKQGKKTSLKELTTLAEHAFDGKTGTAFEIKDAYDAVEMAINLMVEESAIKVDADPDQARRNIDAIREWIEFIPTQTRRTSEMDALQQFSTPPHFAYVASWVAGVKPGDVGLEPSAGLGGLAVWMAKAGADVVINELSPRRREMLDALHIGRPAYAHDSGLLHALVLPDIKHGKTPMPTVVVMNPPFSNNAAGRKDLLTGAKHIEEALKLLKPGGRLVAIVGEGMALEAPRYKGWWDRIRKTHDVRANIKVDGSEYRKYGTTFSNRILVIDKTTTTNESIVGGDVQTIDDLIQLLEPVRTTRPNESDVSRDSSPSPEPRGDRPPEEGRPDSADVPGPADLGTGETRPGSRGSGGQRGGKPAGGDRAGRDEAGDRNTGGVDRTSGSVGTPAGGSGGTDPGGNQARVDSEVERETAANKREVDDEKIFSDYTPTKFRLKGAQKHPTTLVESSVMASTELPDVTTKLNLPKETVENGDLSDAQLEAIAYASQAHDTVFEDGTRQGFFIGDGTGVGKGREIAGTVLHNWREGRKMSIWISEKAGLAKDARRDLDGIGGKEIPIHDLTKTQYKQPAGDGVAFMTYDGLKNGFLGVNKEGGLQLSGKGNPRIQALVKWLGKDFDGVIALDEVHNAGNVIPIKNTRGYTQPSQKGLRVVDLQKVFPKARVLYVSATGATEPNNLAFGSRLGLWGLGKAFPNAERFYNEIKAAGISAMEIVARDLKSLGRYMARTLSFKGVGFERIEHNLTPAQDEIYRKAAEGWQTIFENLDSVLDATGAGNSASAKSAASSLFWGSQQRFFNGLLTAMQMPSAIADMKRRLDEGGSVVIQLVNTNEASLDRAIDRALSENPENPDYENFDLSSRQDILDYIYNSFPVQQFHEVSDGETSDGNPKTKWVPLTTQDADGKTIPVLNPEAVEKRDRLLEQIATIPLPDPPLEQLINEFGADKIAEITGRSKRLVRKTNRDSVVERVLETGRGKPRINKEKNDFLDGKRRILVFSDAGGTGFSYHAGANFKNQQKRYQYVVQAGWRADKAIQGLGRSHRADQVVPPHFILVSTNVNGHKRFISTIARRLQQLGALTSGERKTTGQGLFSEDDNLEDEYAELAVRRFFNDLFRERAGDLNFDEVTRRLGYQKTRTSRTTGETEIVNTLLGEDGSLNSEKIPPLKQFLNRILALPITEQNAVFEAFIERRNHFVEQAKSSGDFDSGVETYKVDEPEIVNDEVVFEDPNSSAKTRLVELKYKRFHHFNDFEFVKGYAKNPRYVVSRDGKRVYALGETNLTITMENGDVVSAYQRYGIKSRTIEPQEKFKTGERPGYAKIGDRFTKNGKEWEITDLPTKESPNTRAKMKPAGSDEPSIAMGQAHGGTQAENLRGLYEATGNVVEGVNENAQYLPDYYELNEADAEERWQAVLDAEPKFEERSDTFIVGSTLPVWHRIPFPSKKVKRVKMDDGNSFLGVLVPDYEIDRTRSQLGAASQDITPVRARAAVVDRNARVELSNGWIMKRTLSAGENRIEVVGPEQDAAWFTGSLPRWKSYGFIERINFKPRFFLPDEIENIDRLLRYAPAMRVIESGDLEVAPLSDGRNGDDDSLLAAPLAQSPFYSRLTNAVSQAPFGQSKPKSPMQWRGVIEKWAAGWSSAGGALWSKGIAQEELKWSGVLTWLDGQKQPLTKQQVLDYLEADGAVRFEEVVTGDPNTPPPGWKVERRGDEWEIIDPSGTPTESSDSFENGVRDAWRYSERDPITRYAQYTLPGGESYREVVLVMPEQRGGRYTSSHFPEVPNYVAHMRTNEREDAEGKPGLFIEEIQSDRHQEGRKKGYRLTESERQRLEELNRKAAVPNGVDPEGKLTKPELAEWEALAETNDNETGESVASAPFRKDWPLQMFKRALRDAVAGGKDWIGWTTGETQNDRFDLSKQVEEVRLFNHGGGNWDVSAIQKGGGLVDIASRITDEKLPDYVGKDLATKATETQTTRGWHTYTGLDLQVGGSGMKGFYDNMLPKEVQKYVKQWGGKVEQSQLQGAGIQSSRENPDGTFDVTFTDGEEGGGYESLEDALADAPDTPIWRVSITPEMRAGVTEGQSLFAAPLNEGQERIKELTEEGRSQMAGPEVEQEARDEQAAFADEGKVIGRPDLANISGDEDVRAEVDVIDQMRKYTQHREEKAQWEREGKRLAQDEDAVAEKWLEMAYGDNPGGVRPEDVVAARVVMERRVRESNGDKQKLADAGVLIHGYREARANQARVLAAGVDPFQKPSERHRAYIAGSLYDLPKRLLDSIQGRAKTPEEARQMVRGAILKRLEKIEKALKKQGVTLDQITNGEVYLSLKSAKVFRDTIKEYSQGERAALRMIQKAAPISRIRKATGLSDKRIEELRTEVRAKLRDQLREMVANGMKLEDIRDAIKRDDSISAAPLSTEEIEAELDRILDVGFGLNTDYLTAKPKRTKKPKSVDPHVADWTRPEFIEGLADYDFDTKDRAEVIRRVEAIRAIAGAAGKIGGLSGTKRILADKQLIAINRILAKYGTDVGTIIANENAVHDHRFDISDRYQVMMMARTITAIDADLLDKGAEYYYSSILSGIQTMMVNATTIVPAMWEATMGRAIESGINTIFRDKRAANLAETKYIVRAMGPMLARAWTNAAATWGSEMPVFEEDVLGNAPDLEAIFEGRSVYGSTAIAGKKGRVIRIPSRILLATDEFVKTAIACSEVGAMAYRIARSMDLDPGTAEFDEMLKELVNTPGSIAWQWAAKKAYERTFTAPLPGQTDIATGKKVPIKGIGDVVGFGAGKLASALSHETDSSAAKAALLAARLLFFPFQRVPFNIIRSGIRRTLNPISLIDIGVLFSRNMRFQNGKWTLDARGEKAEIIERLGQQAQGALLLMLVMGLGEGDDDDLEKPILITGSKPWSDTQRGERDLGYRMGLGPFEVSMRLPNGARFGFNYGRLEPFATVLGATIDTVRETKRAIRGRQSGDEAVGKVFNSLKSQITDKTFLRGISDLYRLSEGDSDLSKWVASRIGVIVPNFIRQPVRESDPSFREKPDDFLEALNYELWPYGRGEAKRDIYGEPVTKDGSAIQRIFDFTDLGHAEANRFDEMIYRYAQKHPSEEDEVRAYFPQGAPKRWTDPITGKSGEMTAKQYAKFTEIAGRRGLAMLRGQPFNYNNPQPDDIERLKRALLKGREDARKILYRNPAWRNAN